jgi:hypothetical protein
MERIDLGMLADGRQREDRLLARVAAV